MAMQIPRRSAGSSRTPGASRASRASGKVEKRPTAMMRPQSRTMTKTLALGRTGANAIHIDDDGKVHILTQAPAPQSSPKRRSLPGRLIADETHPGARRIQPLPLDQGETRSLELPTVGHSISAADVESLVHNITAFFQEYVVPDTFMAPPTFFDDVNLVLERLVDIALLPSSLKGATSVSRSIALCLQAHAQFVYLWRDAVKSALSDSIARLQKQITADTRAIPESVFTVLTTHIRAVAPRTLYRVLTSAGRVEPSLLSQDEVDHALRQCEHLHLTFQQATYVGEAQSLWLMVWQCLKTNFKADETTAGGLSNQGSIEASFFGKPPIRRELRRLLSRPDAANPRGIEKIVGEYCHHVAKCLKKDDPHSTHLRRSSDTPLQSHVMRQLQQYVDTAAADVNVFHKLHFAVVRLNALYGGPVVVRRWSQGTVGMDWLAVPIDPPTDPATMRSRSRSTLPPTPPVAQTEQTGNHTEMVPGLLHPQGYNVKSAYDYVSYPFPETRAQEVAQNEQINRELAEPGIDSTGPRADLLINRPPRHTRNPSELSTLTSKRRIGPFDWIGLLVRSLFSRKSTSLWRRGSSISRLTAPKPKPAQPLRRLLDPRARVHKTPNGVQAVRLRGGGEPPPDPYYRPQKKLRMNVPQISNSQKRHMQLFKAALQRQFGINALESETRHILDLLEEAGNDVAAAVQEYMAPSPPRLHAQLQTLRRNLPNSPTPEPAPRRGLRRRNQPSSPASDAGSQRGRRQRGAGQPDRRQPNRRQPSNQRGSGRSNSQANGSFQGFDDNQENVAPRHPVLGERPDLRGLCHECPQFLGQYHHFCQCHGQQEPQSASPSQGQPSEGGPGGASNQGSSGLHPPIHSPGNGQQSQASGSSSGPQSGRQTRPPAVNHSTDAKLVSEIVPAASDLRAQVERVVKSNPVLAVKELIGPESMDDNLYQQVDAAIEALRSDIHRIRDAYLSLFSPSDHDIIGLVNDPIPYLDQRLSRQVITATPALVRHACIQLDQALEGLNTCLSGGPHTHVSLRHRLNRCIRTMRNLRRLWDQFARVEGVSDSEIDSQDSQDSDPDSDSDSDSGSDSSEGAEGASGHSSAQPSMQPPALPRREDYGLLFKDELERELYVERQVLRVGRRQTNAQLIDRLLEMDQHGVLGRGARNGYRVLMNDPGARVRPKDFKLEDAIQADQQA